MRILLVQLSDIHIKSADDRVLKRAREIVAAVRGIELRPAAVVLVLTGDITWSGTDEQYTLAYEFLAAILKEIAESFPSVPVHSVAIPGNHDCDFTKDSSTRRKLVESFGAGRSSDYDASEIDACLSVQQGFFDFRDAIATGSYDRDTRLYYEYRIVVESTTVLFRCCNTAWLSQIKELPGHIYYPAREVQAQEGGAELVVTLFHHPLNWLTPNSARVFRRTVEDVSDILLSGHEHDYTERRQHTRVGATNLYVEGSALQEDGRRDESAFNVLVVDLKDQRQKVTNVIWNGALYACRAEPEWSDYLGNRARSRDSFVLRESFAAQLDDPGLNLTHPRRGPLSLDNVFVYPDMREILFKRKDTPLLSSREIVDLTVDTCALVTGPERCGKTSLAKRLFLDYRERGLVPVLLDGEKTRGFVDDRLYKEIKDTFVEQYDTASVERFAQLKRESRVVLIDDFEHLSLRGGSLDDLLRTLLDFAQRVVLFSEDIAQRIREIVGNGRVADTGPSLRRFQLQQFGHRRRVEMIERWLDLDPPEAEDIGERAHRLLAAKNTMDTAIGRNYVPSFPVFLLPILQTQDHNAPVDLNASTYGYFYELLIRGALAKGSTRESYDIKMGYLAFVAYRFFERRIEVASEHELREVHEEYEKVYGLALSYLDLVQDLQRCGVLEASGNEFGFKYHYIYYYFVASYIRDHITEGSVQRVVGHLADDLTSEGSTNILMFLAHLSKHPFIIDRMLDAGRRVFADTKPEELRGELPFLAGLDKTIEEVTYEDRDARELRDEMYAALDAQNDRKALTRRDARKEFEDRLEHLQATAIRFAVAFRTMQILGQLLKNFPGSMEANRKLELVRECYGIGLRTLGGMYEVMAANQEEFVEAVREALRESGEGVTDTLLKQYAQESLAGLAQLVTTATIVRTSYAVGSPHLESIYDQVRVEANSPAVDLIYTSLRLEQFRSFPKALILELSESLRGNFMGFAALRSLVVRHFGLVDVRFDVKQQICERLKINLKAIQQRIGRAKLLAR